MRALVIKPRTVNIQFEDSTNLLAQLRVDHPFEWVELRGEEKDHLDQFQSLVGGPVEILPSPWKVLTFWSNEEAKLHPELALNSIVTTICKPLLAEGDYISGNVVVTGNDPETGEDKDLLDPSVATQFYESFFELIDFSIHRRAGKEQK